MHVGLVGVGNMGGAIAARLCGQGFDVAVRDIDPAREAEARAHGATVCASAADVARRSDCVLVVVVNAAQTDQVLFGPDGVAGALARGRCVLLCPTLGPGDVEGFAARLAAAGLACLDAPMSGGPLRARAGRMSLMLAGEPAVLQAHETLLAAMSSARFVVSERPGDAARTKLVNNLLAAINLAGAAEALALATQLGLDARRTLEVIEQSSGQSWIGSDRLRRALDGDYAPRAHTTLLAKDSALALQAAAAVGARPALGEVAAALFARACAEGCAALDDASLLPWLQGHLAGGVSGASGDAPVASAVDQAARSEASSPPGVRGT